MRQSAVAKFKIHFVMISLVVAALVMLPVYAPAQAADWAPHSFSKKKLSPEDEDFKTRILDIIKDERSSEGEGAVPGEDYPLTLTELQSVAETNKDLTNLGEEFINTEIGLDIRRDAQREAAISYGARGGLAMRTYQITRRISKYEAVLDQTFDFQRLLIQAPSGLLIEPPVISESEDALIITEGGVEAAVADKIYNINKNAKIVTAPRNWRHYLQRAEREVSPPPRILWPENDDEQIEWDGWVRTGWQAGFDQADDIFTAQISRLLADFNGMVRYRMLLAQHMVSQPYALHEDRGITGGGNEMRVGDRAIRITGPSQFQMSPEQWKPADR